MADNPFYPKYSLGLLGMLTTPPAQEPDNPLARALGLIPQKPALPVSPLGAAVSDLFPPTMPRTNPPNNLTGLASVDLFQPFGSLASPRLPVGPLKPAVKRKAFFSFHYDDIMRVASSGRLARVLQRLHSTSSQPRPPLRHCAMVGDGCAGPPWPSIWIVLQPRRGRPHVWPSARLRAPSARRPGRIPLAYSSLAR
jgi:hypothetical protein